LNTIPGIARASSIQILGEIAFYGDYLKPRSLVALAGLDPREFQSGKSRIISKGISRRGSDNFRRALYMPGIVAKRCDPNIKAFSEHLTSKGKKPKQVTCAVMRKLIHSISGMFKADEPWNGEKFFKMN
ncbi:transposase, partial [bacterium]|nr:transposase [bacterium]MBU1025804.1 transposase [bacterium]